MYKEIIGVTIKPLLISIVLLAFSFVLSSVGIQRVVAGKVVGTVLITAGIIIFVADCYLSSPKNKTETTEP
jgi:hypothetical protein